MFEKALMFYLYAETPLHPGSDSSINSPADLPIQRERHTGFPIIQGSSMKGVLRASACEMGFTEDDVKTIFGGGEDGGAGCVSITDARILAFPVRTLAGAFGWITCPLVIDRYMRNLKLANGSADWKIPAVKKGEIIVKDNSNIKVEQDDVYIEELRLIAKSASGFEHSWAAISKAIPEGMEYELVRKKINTDLGIVDDEIFSELVSLTTEVIARIAIESNTGTARHRALWYEETLPTDSVMYSLILVPKCSRNNLSADDIIKKFWSFNGKIINVGGDETIGRGFVRVRVVSC